MNDYEQLKDILNMSVNNAVSRMKILKRPADRRCLFNEYKEYRVFKVSKDMVILDLPEVLEIQVQQVIKEILAILDLLVNKVKYVLQVNLRE